LFNMNPQDAEKAMRVLKKLRWFTYTPGLEWS
jgi:hypothetical protein